jgi:hypothetical protein
MYALLYAFLISYEFYRNNLDNFRQYAILKFNKFANFNCSFVSKAKKENELNKRNKTLLSYTCN